MPSVWQKRRFVEHLIQGGLVAYPTEAVFGLGCDPLNSIAVARLLALKNREQKKGLILIASDFSQISAYVKPLTREVTSKVFNVNQKPTTWLLPAHWSAPEWITGEHQTIGVRLVQHGLAKELCALAGTAMVSTSANVAGAEPLRTAYQTRLRFQNNGVYTINGRVGGAKEPSRIIDPLSNMRIR